MTCKVIRIYIYIFFFLNIFIIDHWCPFLKKKVIRQHESIKMMTELYVFVNNLLRGNKESQKKVLNKLAALDGVIVLMNFSSTLFFESPRPNAGSSTKIGSHMESCASISLCFILAYRASSLWTTFPTNHWKHTKSALQERGWNLHIGFKSVRQCWHCVDYASKYYDIQHLSTSDTS